MKSPQPTKNSLLSQCRSYNELHMLYSMLPKIYNQYPREQFKKTKDFFKAQQCIWNNPHRTSDRLYKYYHKAADDYQRLKEPLIAQQEQQDRECKQLTRIRHLSLKRQETRFRFHSKQLQRLTLQNRSGIVRDPSTQFILRIPNISTKNHDNAYEQPTSSILRRSNSQSSPFLTNKNNFLYRKIKTSKEEQTSMNEKSYLRSKQNYDSKNQALIQTIKKSQKQMKDQIRQNFVKQKQNNQLANSTIQGFGQTKLAKSTIHKKKNVQLNFYNLSKKKLNKQNFQHQRS